MTQEDDRTFGAGKATLNRVELIAFGSPFTHFDSGQHHFRIFVERQDLFRLAVVVLRRCAAG